MRGRVLIGLIAVLVIAAGCSSTSKSTKNAPAAGAATLGIAGGSISLAGSIGVVASGTGKQTVPADLAAVVVAEGDSGVTPNGQLGVSGSIGITTLTPNGQPSNPPTSASADVIARHTAIRAALRPLGIATSAITFSTGNIVSIGDDSDESVAVEIPVAKLPKIATDVVAAIKKADPNAGTSGLRFGVANCATAVTTARDEAIADAHTRAGDLATAAGVTLGDLASVGEVSGSGSSPIAALIGNGANACGHDAVDGTSATTTPLPPLTAKPKVELDESVQATYALADTSARTLSSTGFGEVSGPADAAEIVVVPNPDVRFDPSTPPKPISAARVLAALAPLGIAKSKVEVESPITLSTLGSPTTSSSYVRVRVTIPQLTSIGAKIVSTVESIVGTDGTAGVLFTSVKCESLVARARAAAAADAATRITNLARAAKVQAGPVVGVSLSNVGLGFTEVDPCHPDLSELSNLGVLSYASVASGAGLPSLTSLDANPQVTETVSLNLSRAITS